jgi:hypothetical protein
MILENRSDNEIVSGSEMNIKRRNFIFAILAITATSQLSRFYPMIMREKNIVMRSGWILLEDDQ